MRDKKKILLLIIILFVLLEEFRLYSSNLLVDDTFISMRYARNLASGKGFVWNQGESPIDGFTSILYVIGLAGFAKSGIDIVASSQIIGITCSIGVVILTYAFSSMFTRRANWQFLAPILLVVNPSFVVWARSGMETQLYTMLLLISVYSYAKVIQSKDLQKQMRWGLATAIGFLLASQTRPEAIAIFLLTILFDIVSYFLKSRKSAVPLSWSKISGRLIIFVVFLIPFLIIMMWRLSYFGDILPNTYYAKLGGGLFQLVGGFSYIMQWLSSSAISLWVVLAIIGFVSQALNPIARYLGIIIITYVLIVIGEGGDWMTNYRFLVPILPFIAILTQEGIIAIVDHVFKGIEENIWLYRVTLILFIVLIMVTTFWPSINGITKNYGQLLRPIRLIDNLDDGWVANFTRIGSYFASHSKLGDSIAVGAAGAIPYYSGLLTIDMMGLNDRHIAHTNIDPELSSWLPGATKGDGNYVLERKPTFILLISHLTRGPQPGITEEEQHYKTQRELWDSSKFMEMYEFKSIELGPYGYLNYYQLRE